MRWLVESNDIIGASSVPAGNDGGVQAWFKVADSNWNYRFGGSGISSSSSDGFGNHDIDSIEWRPEHGTDKKNHIESDDNIYLYSPEHDKGAVITDTRPYGTGNVPAKTLTDYGLPINWVDGYHVKKGDKPQAKPGDIVEHVTVDYDQPLSNPGTAATYNGFKISDYKNYEKVKLVGDSDAQKGNPCPGTFRVGFVEPKKIRCLYNDAEVKALADSSDTYSSSNSRVHLKNNVIKKFCDTPGNEEKAVGNGKTCLTWDTQNTVAKRYCEKDENIINKNRTCTPEKYASYHESAIKFCKNNPYHNWCKCYNSLNVCSQNDSAAGCSDYKRLKDSYKSLEGSLGYDQIVNNLHCSTGCNEATYKPSGFQQCNQNITVCGMTVQTGNLNDSTATLNQNCKSGDSPSTSSPGTTSPPGTTEEKEQNFSMKYWWIILLILILFGVAAVFF